MSSRFNRGTSVLAALILSAFVGSIALAIHEIATPAHDLALSAASQSAAAPAANASTAGASPSSKAYDTKAPKSCDAAIQKAITEGSVSDGVAENPDAGQSGIVDPCFGAYSKTGKPSKNPSDYECKGRGGTATIADGKVTVTTRVNLAADKGQCLLVVCQDGKCSAAKKYDNGVSFNPEAVQNADLSKGIQAGNGNEPTPYISSATDPNNQSLNNAFDATPAEIKAATDAQIEENNKTIADLSAYLNKCENGDQCPDADAAFQKKSDLETQNAALQQQSEELSKSVSQDVTQTDAQRMANLQAQCDAGNCDARDYATLQAYKDSQSAAQKYENLKAQCDAGNCDAKDLRTLAMLKQQSVPKNPLGNGNTFNPGGGQQQQPQQPEEKSSGLGGLLQGMLGGLMKALGGAAGGGAGGSGNCTQDQNQYQQQQQQYQQQMQLYNQQLQQYNYQTQMAQYNGYPPPPPPTPPSQPCFNQSSTPVQCSSSPAQPAASGCQNGTWKPTTQSGNSCISGWQCVPTGSGSGSAPTAQLSCQPQVADVGMAIAISFSCGNSTGSAGSGFDTGNQTSGSASTTIATPPAGATKVTYGLQCKNATSQATASCSIDISHPSIILVANPKVVPVNASSTIGWITTGMKSCVVSSPNLEEFNAQNVLNTSVNGAVVTPALTQSADFLLHCVTQGGQTKDATTTVFVGAPDGTPTQSGINVTSDADGKSIARGNTINISWTSDNSEPAAAKMSLWLYDVRLGEATSLITVDKSQSGSFAWKTPTTSDTCDPDTQTVCASDLVPGRKYGIEAALYTGATTSPTYVDYNYTPDVFTISQ